MNFRASKSTRPIVDMDRFATELEAPPSSYVPPAFRSLDEPIVQVKKFAELPTSELDEMIFSAEADLERIKAESQHIRDVYVKYTNKVVSDINRLQEGIKASMETLKTLRDQCQRFDVPDQEPELDQRSVPPNTNGQDRSQKG